MLGIALPFTCACVSWMSCTMFSSGLFLEAPCLFWGRVTHPQGMDYYKSQKEWLGETMKKQTRLSASAMIIKPSVMKKVRTSLSGIHKEMRPAEPTGNAMVDEILAPQFFQHAAQSSDLMVNTHTHTHTTACWIAG